MTYKDGEIYPRSEQEWLDIMIESAEEYFGGEISEREGTALHRYYRPVASQFEELEQELENVMHALRLKDAEGKNLDIIGERLGVGRNTESTATGVVTLYRGLDDGNDYYVQKGAALQTRAFDPIVFQTTETVTLSAGQQSITAEIKAIESGDSGNVAANTITRSADMPPGVDSLTNTSPTSGGSRREPDEEYRRRIIQTIAQTDSASGFNISRILEQKGYIRNVKYFDQYFDSGSVLNAHEAEVLVDAEPGHNDEIAQTIFEQVPMGIDLRGGVRGTQKTGVAELGNGQTFTIPFSEPTNKQIYISVDVESVEPVDKATVKNAIIDYIGGERTSGQLVAGDLNAGDNVIAGEVEFSARTVDNVYDVKNLKVGTASPPAGDTNVPVANDVRASTDAASITISTTLV